MADEVKWEWRPIDTAPRDGTPVLLWSIYEMIDGACSVAVFAPDFDSWVGMCEGDLLDIKTERGLVWWKVQDPTHWMPLPPPPQQPA